MCFHYTATSVFKSKVFALAKQIQICLFLLYNKIMNISTRRLLTSVTRKIGGFFYFQKNFQEIFEKHPPKTLSHFKQVKGVIPNHENGSLSLVLWQLNKSFTKTLFLMILATLQKRQSVRVAFCNAWKTLKSRRKTIIIFEHRLLICIRECLNFKCVSCDLWVTD